MILYCDTSALVKRYIREPFTDTLLAGWLKADRIATSEIAFAETVSALSRRFRQGDLEEDRFLLVRGTFSRDFRNTLRVAVSEQLHPTILELVQSHSLRGLDAIHLASAMLVQNKLRESLVFACYDARLAEAAKSEGLSLLN